ncbi:MAG: HlyD family efflux transporter periplasmic adaptor subunit [Dysgonamonadaceae bacterium]|jgi:HlyD family secretion protein|nr:HlyD family efflux transporter periplasmic adaptor subunit [Dysgonamonadaceae bacterium]
MGTNKSFLITIVVTLLSACNHINNEYDASGIFETTEIIVSAKGSGEIISFDVSEGQNVEAQTSLGLIDTTQLYLKKMQLQANIRSTNSRRINVSRQIAALQQQIETQHREQKRFEMLVKQNAANQKQLDDINAQVVMLEKQLDAQIETLNNSNNSLTNEQESLAIQIALINDQIKNCIIKSPIKGTILTKYTEVGESTIQGKAIFKMGNIENMYLRAYITASQLTDIRLGQQVKVYSDTGESDRKEHSGTITWISDEAEFTPKTIQTRDERANLVYAIKVAVTNDGYIKKGMYGEIRFNK